ncbi:37S ribosomal protein S23 mitochondrial [Ceratobasidium sp. 414]|nr:37S ribosomal protein S23 mitochondrial [Ceratobasidium sp. 414]
MLSRIKPVVIPRASQVSPVFRSFSAPSFVARAKAAKHSPAPAKKSPHKSGGFKVKKEEYVSSRKAVGSSKPTVLPASQLAEHHLLQSPPRELGLAELTPVRILLKLTGIFTTRATGSAIALPSKQGSIIGTYGVPLSVENEFSLLSCPTSVIRDTTLSILDILDTGAKTGTSSKDARVVLTGDSGAGKSHLLLQAANYAAVNKMSTSLKNICSNKLGGLDNAPELALQTLGQFVEANADTLNDAGTQIATDIQSERLGNFSKGTPLSKLLAVGLKDQSLATEVLEVTLRILGEQTKYPILIAVDDFQAFFCMSKYRDPQYELIFAHHLILTRIILEYASGKRTLARGVVLGATSSTNSRFLEPLPLKEALGTIASGTVSPYERRNKNIVAYASGLKGFPIPSKMRVDEAASMFDVWVQNYALHTSPSDSLFLSKYVEASGNPRDMVKTGLLATLGTS